MILNILCRVFFLDYIGGLGRTVGGLERSQLNKALLSPAMLGATPASTSLDLRHSLPLSKNF